MTTDHPITPPPELVQEWIAQPACQDYFSTAEEVAIAAARWGADQELGACCADLRMVLGPAQADWLRSVRRPKPPSLAEKGLQAWCRFQDCNGHSTADEMACDFAVIRRALERLQELEGHDAGERVED